MTLAVAIGFHKARQFELALPYAETAAAKLDTPAAHLNFGDLLLTLAESQSDPKQQRSSLERAVAEYDLVLKAQPNSIEAINNKAWILHTYLDQSRQALELVLALAKTRELGRAAGRVLRHAGLDPGVHRQGPRRRAGLYRRLEEVTGTSGAQLPLRQDDRQRPQPGRQGPART